ncbi:MAG: dihydroorotate dehydrogenase electron transfer subunit [Clostridiales bacterium]|nr:dihydroorotate dehydrogenase electron transfer subunit [Clostridiales bacterium]
MKQAYDCRLIKKSEPIAGVFDYTIEAPEIAAQTQCGQFLHINCGKGTFLRRPISICDAEGTSVRFIFEVKGEGTRELSQVREGEIINVMGPLGHGFNVPSGKRAVLIGGGIGIFPLFKLAKQTKPVVFLGFRSADRVMMEEEFEAVSTQVFVGTDDGSYGYNGYIANAMNFYLNNNPCDVICACGPLPMLRAVKEIAEKRGIECQVSMEQRMGCGIGACLVCTCESTKEGTDKNLRVCKHGPVFDSREVTLR